MSLLKVTERGDAQSELKPDPFRNQPEWNRFDARVHSSTRGPRNRPRRAAVASAAPLLIALSPLPFRVLL